MDSAEYHREYYRSVRRPSVIEYLGGKCAVCGERELLEIDHIDPAQKSFNLSKNLTLSNPEVLKELEKCQLLCAKHHREKTAKENSGFTHGTTYGWMKRKCDCSQCDEAKKAWHSERNSKRRSKVNGRQPYGHSAPHGSSRSYKRGCTCNDCKAANSLRVRHHRQTGEWLPTHVRIID